MKSFNNLIDGIYTLITHKAELVQLLGKFDTSTVAIAYGEVPTQYDLPTRDRVFIVYSIETSQAKSSETKSRLSETVVKFYVSGQDSTEACEYIREVLEASIISSFHCSYMGTTLLPNGDATIRFKFI